MPHNNVPSLAHKWHQPPNSPHPARHLQRTKVEFVEARNKGQCAKDLAPETYRKPQACMQCTEGLLPFFSLLCLEMLSILVAARDVRKPTRRVARLPGKKGGVLIEAASSFSTGLSGDSFGF